MKKLTFLLVFISLLLTDSLDACTSVIISGKYTADGRPIMWKHRDTSNENNKLVYVTSGMYTYIAMVNTGEKELTAAWMGMNIKGFCIMEGDRNRKFLNG